MHHPRASLADNTNTRLFAGFRKWLSKVHRICLPLFSGRWGTPVPFNVQLAVAIGSPVPYPAGPVIDASGKAIPEAIERYQEAYIAALQAMFEQHKQQVGYAAERRLEVLRA